MGKCPTTSYTAESTDLNKSILQHCQKKLAPVGFRLNLDGTAEILLDVYLPMPSVGTLEPKLQENNRLCKNDMSIEFEN